MRPPTYPLPDSFSHFSEASFWLSPFISLIVRVTALLELQILVKLSSEEDDNIHLEQPLREQFSSFFDISSSAHGDDIDGQPNTEPQSARKKIAKLSLRAESESDNDSWSSDDSDDSDDSDEDETDAKADTAKVNFNHTSIRQYFQAGINTKVGAAGIDTLESKVHVVRVLLKSIVEWKQWSGFDADSGSSASGTELGSQTSASTAEHDQDQENDKSGSNQVTSEAGSDDDDDDPNANALIAYAASNWHLHLAALDPAMLQSEDKSAIAALLIRLFRDREIIWIWIEDVEDFSSKWLETRENVQLVYGWLQHFLTLGLLSGEDADWVKALDSASTEALLAIVMDEFAKDWLENEDSTWSGNTVFQWLKKYTEVVSAFPGQYCAKVPFWASRTLLKDTAREMSCKVSRVRSINTLD
jgi:hypothetical protein